MAEAKRWRVMKKALTRCPICDSSLKIFLSNKNKGYCEVCGRIYTVWYHKRRGD